MLIYINKTLNGRMIDVNNELERMHKELWPNHLAILMQGPKETKKCLS
jgi:hypothetical protein